MAGSSLRRERAFIEANPPIPTGMIAASLPPVIMMSALPNWSIMNESAMDIAEEAQAAVVQ